MLCCVLINESTLAFDGLTLDWLTQLAVACSAQLNRDVAPIYGGLYSVRVGSGPTDVQPGEMVFAVVDSLPDAPGAIAYHDVNGQAVPVAFLALSTCSSLSDVSTAVSHELCETAGDAACDLWCDDGQGNEWARELCDAVESNSYQIDGIPMSDFLLPAFFSAGASGPFSFCALSQDATTVIAGLPSAPFGTAAGGYQLQRQSGTNETQVTGSIRANRQAKVHHWSSRPSRRGLAAA